MTRTAPPTIAWAARPLRAGVPAGGSGVAQGGANSAAPSNGDRRIPSSTNHCTLDHIRIEVGKAVPGRTTSLIGKTFDPDESRHNYPERR